jgi:molybdopterin-guanine dinucleotide biosynthesis protein A
LFGSLNEIWDLELGTSHIFHANTYTIDASRNASNSSWRLCLLSNTAIILAGGSSTRLGQDKALLKLGKKPLVRHVLDSVRGLVDETILVVSSPAQETDYQKYALPDTRIAVDKRDMRTPLVGALTGFESAHGEYSLVLPCDVPFVSQSILSLLLDLSLNKNAVIPRWPNGHMEPLQAVYRTKVAKVASNDALDEGKLDMQAMVDRLQGIRYVSTLVLMQLDPELRTFFNVNTLIT